MAKSRVRYREQTISRDRAGRFTRAGRPRSIRETVRQPRPPTKTSGLPKYLVLKDGTRVLTTGPYGQQILPLLDMLQQLGLTLPDTPIPVSELKSAYDGLRGKRLEIEEPEDEDDEEARPRRRRRGILPVRRVRKPERAREPGRVREPVRGRAPDRKAAPRAAPAPRKPTPRRPATYTVTVRRDRFGRFNARGRTIQRVKVRRKR